MLQQTRVETVIPYFERFMSALPSIAALAAASEDQVLALWSGLGYYSRARNLKRAAEQIERQHQGRFPESFAQVVALPGVGRSTAGAILSLALGQRHPILDGNVRRVLSRCFLVAGLPQASATQRQLWQLAERCTPQQRVAAYNQAMMDLGALLCGRRPGCGQCPLTPHCQAWQQGVVGDYPQPRRPRQLPSRQTYLLLITDSEGAVLLERRPPSGVWGGLWSLPECTLQQDPQHWCREQLGLDTELLATLPQSRHTFSHYHLDYTPLRMRAHPAGQRCMDAGERLWYNVNEPLVGGIASPIARLLAGLKT